MFNSNAYALKPVFKLSEAALDPFLTLPHLYHLVPSRPALMQNVRMLQI